MKRSELKQIIRDVMEEANLPKLSPDQVTYKKTKTSKPLPSRDGATRVEAELKNSKELGNIASGIGIIAYKIDAAKTELKKLDEEKTKLDSWARDAVDQLFPIGDELLTRVIDTAGYSIVVNKYTERTTEKFDLDLFMEQIELQLSESAALIRTIIDSSKIISKTIVTPKVEITPKEEGFVSSIKNVIKLAITKLQESFNKLTSLLKSINKRDDKLEKMTKSVAGSSVVSKIHSISDKLVAGILNGEITTTDAVKQMKKIASSL